MTINWTKPIRTKNGDPAELIHVLEGEEYPCVVVLWEKGVPSVVRYPESGRYLDDVLEAPRDLVNVPEQWHCYLNVYKDGSSDAHYSMEDADRGRTTTFSGEKIGGTLHLTFEGNHLVGVEKIDD